MQVKLLKPLLHQAKQHWTGTVINIDDHLVERLEKLGVVTRDADSVPSNPTKSVETKTPENTQLSPADGVEEEKEDKPKGDGIEEGGSEDKEETGEKEKVEGEGIEEGGSEDKEESKSTE